MPEQKSTRDQASFTTLLEKRSDKLGGQGDKAPEIISISLGFLGWPSLHMTLISKLRTNSRYATDF